jgi:hypothetical protein
MVAGVMLAIVSLVVGLVYALFFIPREGAERATECVESAEQSVATTLATDSADEVAVTVIDARMEAFYAVASDATAIERGYGTVDAFCATVEADMVELPCSAPQPDAPAVG